MGKGYGSTSIPVHAGIVADLNQLYKQFKLRDSPRLSDFCQVFREMGMNEIWKGRQSAAELIEFSEKLLQISASYMNSYLRDEGVAGTELIAHSFEERLFGLYATYTFYFLQPANYVTAIRVTPEDLHDIADFLLVRLIPAQHLDAACCLFKLVDANAFRIVPYKNCYDPAFHRRYDVPDCEDVLTPAPLEPFRVAREIANDPLLKQIGILQKKFDTMKGQHLPNPRSAKDLCDTLTEMVNKESCSSFSESLRVSSRVVEDVEAARTTLHLIKTGQRPMQHKSSKGAIKDRAYTSDVQYSRTRRYADTNQPDLNGNKQKPVRKSTRLRKRAATAESEDGQQAEEEGAE